MSYPASPERLLGKCRELERRASGLVASGRVLAAAGRGRKARARLRMMLGEALETIDSALALCRRLRELVPVNTLPLDPRVLSFKSSVDSIVERLVSLRADAETLYPVRLD